MSRNGTPALRSQGAEGQQRRIYLGVAALGLLGQGVLAGLPLKQGILPNWNIFFTSILLITVILVVSFFNLRLRVINLIILLDIDHFKQVNDRYGHSVGDQVLQRVVVVMNGVIEDDDVIARWGGEEFLILLSSGRASIDIEVGDRILHSLRAAPMPLSLRMTASCGICRLDEVESLSEWLACADGRLYKAKKLGRDRLQYL